MANEQGRRAFLRLAAAAGGAGLLSSCSRGSGTSAASAASTTSGRTAGTAAATADGAAQAASVPRATGSPGAAAYTVSKRLFDPRFDSLHPAGVAYCRNPHDVATCLAFVRKFGVPVAARCGGHSYAGWSSTSGLIIDVTRMAGVNVSGST